MGKELIRLTEEDLQKIVKELNEIGDTTNGQYMLGRLTVFKGNDMAVDSTNAQQKS